MLKEKKSNVTSHIFFDAWAWRADTDQQSQQMHPLELQTTPWTEKIPSRVPLVVPALSLQKFLTRRSSLWLLPAPPHTRTVQAGTHNGVTNLPDNKKIKLMQHWQSLSYDCSANKPTKGGEKQNKTICSYKTHNTYFYHHIG